jgi:fructoselysine-6-P-deglycase FrlB-like protein
LAAVGVIVGCRASRVADPRPGGRSYPRDLTLERSMTTEPAFDPDAPLPGPPEPWAATDAPTLRDGPPYHMTDMIAAEPALARRILEALAGPGPAADLATAIRATVTVGAPVVVTGCGTSEHAALAVVEILRDAAADSGMPTDTIVAEQAFELALHPPSRALVVGITHEGGTAATNAALTAARGVGSRSAAITVTDRSPVASVADIVVETHELDQGWCHVVGYLSPICAAAAVAGHLTGRAPDPGTVADLLATGARDEARAEAIAAGLAGTAHLIVIASGADRAAGRELTLKVEEATWLPSAYRDLETFLHGHLPATDARTGLVLILTERRARAERIARARGALAAARTVGVQTAAIVAADASEGLGPELTSLGRLVVDEAPELSAPVAALVGSATPLQLLTERLARARGTNPDPIRRDDPLYVAASEAAEG